MITTRLVMGANIICIVLSSRHDTIGESSNRMCSSGLKRWVDKYSALCFELEISPERMSARLVTHIVCVYVLTNFFN